MGPKHSALQSLTHLEGAELSAPSKTLPPSRNPRRKQTPPAGGGLQQEKERGKAQHFGLWEN